MNLPQSNPYPKPLRDNPGHYLRQWRLYFGLTQELLAERMGVDSSHISKIERSHRGQQQPILDNFAKALGLEPADLLRPPTPDRPEVAAYVMKLDEKQREYALRVLKAVFQDKDAEETACIVLYPKTAARRKPRG